MEMMIVSMEATNRQSIVTPKEEHALAISSHATMVIAFLEFTFAMVTTIV